MNKFSFFPQIGLWPRILIALGLWSLGILMHIYTEDILYFLGWIVVFLGAPVLALKPLSNKPKDQGKEEWRAVTSAEVDRLRDNIAQSNRLKKAMGAMGIFPILVCIGAFFGFIYALDSNESFLLVVIDGLIILLTGVVPTAVVVYIPADVPMKLTAFGPLLHNPAPADMTLTPYLRFDVDEHGQDLPEDLRFMLEPKRKPDDFVGIQFQCTINDGPHGAVPYIYAVALFKGQDGPGAHLLGKPAISGYVVEKGGDDKWGTVVVRQVTSGTGYETTPRQVKALYDHMLQLSRQVTGKV